jgi:hypothetical protein
LIPTISAILSVVIVLGYPIKEYKKKKEEIHNDISVGSN